MKKIILILVLLALLVSFFLIKKESTEEVVNIYSARKENLLRDLFDDFTRDTGIKVNLLTDKSPKLLSRLMSEGKTSPADILITSDILSLQKAKNAKLFLPVKSEKLQKNLPSYYHDDDLEWFAISMRIRALFYNKELFQGELKNYEDLSNKDFNQKLLIRSSHNIYNQALVSNLILYHGENETAEILKSMVGNFARHPQGGDTDQLRALAKGIGHIAVANSYYYARLLNSSDERDKAYAGKIAIIFPNQEEEGSNINISGMGLLTSSKNQKNAIKFMEFLLSEKAQKFFTNHNYEYPVITTVKPNETLISWGDFKADFKALKSIYEVSNKAALIAKESGWK